MTEPTSPVGWLLKQNRPTGDARDHASTAGNMVRDFASVINRCSTLVVAGALCALPALTMRVGRTQQPVFRSAVQTVVVHATVQGPDGRLVPDLPREAFQVLDDGKPVDVTTFSTDPQRLTVAIMVEASQTALGPTTGNSKVAAALRAALVGFVGALGSGERARLGTFGAQVATGGNLTNDVAEVERVLREEWWPAVGAGTPLWQAISEATASIAGETGRRIVLVFTSTGTDTGSLPNWRGDRGTVERQLVEQEAMLYVIHPFGYTRRPLRDAIVNLALSTGGGYFEARNDENLEVVFGRILEELRHQYLLGFSATPDGREHAITVRVTRPGLNVRARKSYLAGTRK